MNTERVVPTMAKVVAWFAIAYGVLTLLAVFVGPWVIARSFSVSTYVIWTVIGLACLVGGWFGLKDREWALVLVAYAFLVQIVEYSSQSFSFSFIGPISAKFGWIWWSPPMYLKVNVLAVVVTVIAFVAARGLTRRSTGRPASGPPVS
jgi:hypothetical protein